MRIVHSLNSLESGSGESTTLPNTSTLATLAMELWRPWYLEEEVPEPYLRRNEENQNHYNKVKEPGKSINVEVTLRTNEDTERRINENSASDQADPSTLPQKAKNMENSVALKENQQSIDCFTWLLVSLNVPSNADWNQCVAIISKDPRYSKFRNLQGRKKIFNEYKTRQQGEELVQFLMSKINSRMTYTQCEETFAETPTWMEVPEPQRRDIYQSCVFHVAQREKNEIRRLRNFEYKVKVKWLKADVSVAASYEDAKKLVEDMKDFELYEKEIGLKKIWQDFIRESEDSVMQWWQNKKDANRVRSDSKSEMKNEQVEVDKSKRACSQSKSVNNQPLGVKEIQQDDSNPHSPAKKKKILNKQQDPN
ncbi:pre-mRNA-processing factor 40 homolog A-like isoform X2 [Drosophila takahashii]|uniref:pre-mRNA-processing factor 40 homolog A-like isoform X2 n=1 Tax=Drosophila takahashii TaxID=29030 RepID=UPI003898E96C